MAKSDPLMRAGHRERLRKKFDAGNASDDDEMELDRKSTRLNSSHLRASRMPSSA